MITTTEALESVLAAMPLFSSESIPAAAATGRVLRQTIRAERDQPPFDRVMMDGIAFSWSDFDGGLRQFPVQAAQAAGDHTLRLDSGHCIEIMTGASLPENADCIVPVEHIQITDGKAEIESSYEVKIRRFIHPRGSDFAQGAHLLQPGKRVSPMDIAIIASCGETDVNVTIDPVIRVVSTGNELVPSGQAVEAHQIRLSNGPALIALLVSHGYRRCQHDHIVDDIDVLRERLAEHLDQASVVVISGGCRWAGPIMCRRFSPNSALRSFFMASANARAGRCGSARVQKTRSYLRYLVIRCLRSSAAGSTLSRRSAKRPAPAKRLPRLRLSRRISRSNRN